jgi:hypothetical protein
LPQCEASAEPEARQPPAGSTRRPLAFYIFQLDGIEIK